MVSAGPCSSSFCCWRCYHLSSPSYRCQRRALIHSPALLLSLTACGTRTPRSCSACELSAGGLSQPQQQSSPFWNLSILVAPFPDLPWDQFTTIKQREKLITRELTCLHLPCLEEEPLSEDRREDPSLVTSQEPCRTQLVQSGARHLMPSFVVWLGKLLNLI